MIFRTVDVRTQIQVRVDDLDNGEMQKVHETARLIRSVYSRREEPLLGALILAVSVMM